MEKKTSMLEDNKENFKERIVDGVQSQGQCKEKNISKILASKINHDYETKANTTGQRGGILNQKL